MSRTLIMDKYGLSTIIPALLPKSTSDVTIKAEAFDSAIAFLYFGRKANEIDSLDANTISSTEDIGIDLSPINLPSILSATSLRVIKVLPYLF
jgi:hypothetical protein